MESDSLPQPGDRSRVLRSSANEKQGAHMSRSARVAQIGLWLAIAGGLALALAPVGYRGGWWSLRVSLFYLLGGAIAIGALAVVVSLVGAFLTRRTPQAQGFR